MNSDVYCWFSLSIGMETLIVTICSIGPGGLFPGPFSSFWAKVFIGAASNTKNDMRTNALLFFRVPFIRQPMFLNMLNILFIVFIFSCR